MANAITPIRLGFPATRITAAPMSTFMIRRAASLRVIRGARTTMRSGRISYAELQRGILTSPNARDEPRPKQTRGGAGLVVAEVVRI